MRTLISIATLAAISQAIKIEMTPEETFAWFDRDGDGVFEAEDYMTLLDEEFDYNSSAQSDAMNTYVENYAQVNLIDPHDVNDDGALNFEEMQDSGLLDEDYWASRLTQAE